jgi:glycosyltransferase involved in cell wall biosynthesis
MAPTLRSLYICYLSLEDPLVQTQVVAYLEGLAARGHVVHLLTFDRPLEARRRDTLRRELRERGIAWHSLRYHKRPSLPATVYDALVGATVAVWLCRRHRLEVLHARNHVPAASALLARRLTGARLIFDLRGLMAEEYVDAGRWREGGLPYRITKRIERAAIRRAEGMVMLTERVRHHLFGAEAPEWAFVIPCCADLERIEAQAGEREPMRMELGTGDRTVMVYVGKLTARYREREMVEFFLSAREERPNLVLLVLTQSDPEVVLAELRRAGVPATDYRVTRAPPWEVGRYLAAADFGVSFYGLRTSEIAASPTKIGEYLAAGLPVVSSAGVGDVEALLHERDVGAVLSAYEPAAYEAAARRILALASDPDCPDRCRAEARRRYSLDAVGIPRYDRLYRLVANG